MNLSLEPADLAFVDEVRQFLAENLPADIRERVRRRDDTQFTQDITAWQKILHEKGWGAAAWPVEFGGTGWSKVQQYLFDTECALADAPLQLAFGLKMVGPVMMQFGSPAQQQHFLPRILAAQDWWCQGYSEPGSGSDLASLKMQAIRDGDDYVVSGQKVWNTLGQFADWIFCLVRTDNTGKPQRGISFLLIDMKSPGISVRPTRLLDGGHEVNEVWFDEVRVPASNLIGEENHGWTYAKFLLGHERTNIAGIGGNKRELSRLKEMARAQRGPAGRMIDNPLFASKIAQVEIELMALEITNLRVIEADVQKRAPGPEASILKIKGTEIQQRLSELQVEAIGASALLSNGESAIAGLQPERDPLSANATDHYLNHRKVTIYGGSNEIQRNIIAQMILQV